MVGWTLALDAVVTGVRAASIQGVKLALGVEEADVGAAAEGGVQEAAAPAGEPRCRAY